MSDNENGMSAIQRALRKMQNEKLFSDTDYQRTIEEYGETGGVIKTWRNPYGMGFSCTRPKQIVFEKGLTILVGCNGIGKTTLLKNIKDELEENNVVYYSYDNLRDGHNSSMGELIFRGEFDLVSALYSSSEGENIALHMSKVAGKIGKCVSANKEAKEFWFLFDAIDSGWSIDNIIEAKELLFKTILDYNQDKNIYIIVSANEYEMACSEKCFDVASGKYIQIKSYEDFKNHILKTRQIKNKRYEKFERSNRK